MRLIDADELRKNVLKWMPSDPCGKEEKEFPFETDICASMVMEIDDAPTVQPERKDALEKAVAVEAISDELMSRFDISATYAYEVAEKAMNRIEAMAKELERGNPKGR